MTLPDASRLPSLPPDQWRAFALRLAEIGLTNEAVLALTRAVDEVPHHLRAPLRRWHLQRAGTDAASALSLLTYGDELPEARARVALGDGVLETLVRAGVLALHEGRYRALFLLTFHGELYVLVDDVLRHGGDAVMGSGRPTVHLSRASIPTTRVARALDFGCGAAPNALALAARADHVVGTDINPRAMLLARVNAAINGITNVEFRVGDMFAPVADERFDVIVAQPPFVARPAGHEARTYLFGGARGDEFPLRVMAEAPALLAPGGVCVCYIEWPELPSDTIERRIRVAQPSEEIDLLVVRAPPAPLEAHAAAYAYAEHALLDEGFDREVIERWEHMHRLGFQGISSTLTVLRRAPPGRKAWTRTVDVRSFDVTTPSRKRIDRLIAARDLLATGDDAALLAAKLQVPKRTSFIEERSEPDPNSDPTMVMRFSERALLPPLGINREAFLLMSVIDASPSVALAAERLARDFQVPLEAALGKLLPHAREALELGALEVA